MMTVSVSSDQDDIFIGTTQEFKTIRCVSNTTCEYKSCTAHIIRPHQAAAKQE